MLRFKFLLLLLGCILIGVADSAVGDVTNGKMIANSDCQLNQTILEGIDQCRIQIGIINSFTDGNGACLAGGVEHARGYELALAEIGEINGCQVDLVAIDDQQDINQARNAVTNFFEDNVPLIIGAYSSSATLEAAAEADRLGIPLIVPSASSDLITSVGFEWVFRINATSADYVSEALALTTTLSDAPSVSVLYENTVFGESAAVAIASQAEALGISIVSYVPFQPGSPGVVTNQSRNTLSYLSDSLRMAKPDVIFMVSNNISDALSIMEHGRSERLTPQLFIGIAGAFLSPDFLELAGDEIENLVATAQWSADSAQQEDVTVDVERFTANFQAAYDGDMPGMRSVQTYTSLLLAKEAIELAALDPRCGSVASSISRACVRDVLQVNSWEHTIFGPVDFDEATGQNSHQVLLLQVIPDNDRYRFVTVFPEQYQTQPLTLETAVSDN